MKRDKIPRRGLGVVMLTGLILATLAGCATVKFSEVGDTGWVEAEGFEYYMPKPYLLLKRTKEGVTAEVLVLPDLSERRAISMTGGWGTAEFSVEANNGVLTKVSGGRDSKGADTLGALGGSGGVIPALAGLGAAGAGGPSFGQQMFSKWFDTFLASQGGGPEKAFGVMVAGAPAGGVTYTQVLTPVAKAVTSLTAAETALNTGGHNSEEAIVKAISAALIQTASGTGADEDAAAQNFVAQYDAAQKAASKAIKDLSDVQAVISKLAETSINAKAALKEVSNAIGQLRDFTQDYEEVEMYEIIAAPGGGIDFKRVYLQ